MPFWVVKTFPNIFKLAALEFLFAWWFTHIMCLGTVSKFIYNTKEDLHCIFIHYVVVLSKLWHIYAIWMFLNKQTYLEYINGLKHTEFTICWLLSHQITPIHLQTMDWWRNAKARLNSTISLLLLHGITKLIRMVRRWLCYIITLTFLCNIHCTIIFYGNEMTILKQQVLVLFLIFVKT